MLCSKRWSLWKTSWKRFKMQLYIFKRFWREKISFPKPTWKRFRKNWNWNWKRRSIVDRFWDVHFQIIHKWTQLWYFCSLDFSFQSTRGIKLYSCHYCTKGFSKHCYLRTFEEIHWTRSCWLKSKLYGQFLWWGRLLYLLWFHCEFFFLKKVLVYFFFKTANKNPPRRYYYKRKELSLVGFASIERK